MRAHFWTGDEAAWRPPDVELILGVAITRGAAVCHGCGTRGYVIGPGAVLDHQDKWVAKDCNETTVTGVMST